MNRIILAAVLIAGCSPAVASETVRKPTLEERVQQIEYWVEREKRLDAQAEKARVDCENARGNNWRRGPDVDPCK